MYRDTEEWDRIWISPNEFTLRKDGIWDSAHEDDVDIFIFSCKDFQDKFGFMIEPKTKLQITLNLAK